MISKLRRWNTHNIPQKCALCSAGVYLLDRSWYSDQTFTTMVHCPACAIHGVSLEGQLVLEGGVLTELWGTGGDDVDDVWGGVEEDLDRQGKPTDTDTVWARMDEMRHEVWR